MTTWPCSLGSHGGDREIFSANELVQEFELARVTPSPAVFDFEKLYWLNRHYIKEAAPERIAALAEPFYQRALGVDELGRRPKHGWRGLPRRWCRRSASLTSCPSAPHRCCTLTRPQPSALRRTPKR